MIKSFYYKTLVAFFSFLGLFVSPAFANEPPRFSAIIPVIYNGIKFLFSFVSIIAAAMVVYGAYMWMFSGGDPQKAKLAQGTLTWSIIGLIFFMIIRFALDFILRLFGIELPMPSGTPFGS